MSEITCQLGQSILRASDLSISRAGKSLMSKRKFGDAISRIDRGQEPVGSIDPVKRESSFPFISRTRHPNFPG